VELSRSLVQTGRLPGQGHGRPVRLDRAAERRSRLRSEQLAAERRLAEAAGRLAGAGVGTEPLDEAQTEVLLRLLDLALAARVTGAAHPLAAAVHGVRLTLTPVAGTFTTAPTAGGALHLDGFTLSVTPVENRLSADDEPMPTFLDRVLDDPKALGEGMTRRPVAAGTGRLAKRAGAGQPGAGAGPVGVGRGGARRPGQPGAGAQPAVRGGLVGSWLDAARRAGVPMRLTLHQLLDRLLADFDGGGG
jgi:hypothetical protein